MSSKRHTFGRLMGFVRPHWPRVALAVAASIVSAAAAAVWTRLLGPLLDSVLTHKPMSLFGVDVPALEASSTLPVLVVGLAVLKALTQWVHGGLMQSVAQLVLATLRRTLYRHVLALPPAFFERRHSGEVLSRFTSDVQQVEFAVSQAMSSWVKDTLLALAMVAVCAATDWRLFVLIFLVVPAMALPVSRFARALKRTASGTQQSLASLTALTAEQLQTLPVVQAYRASGQSLQRFDAEQSRYLGIMRRSLFVRGIFTPTLELFGIVGIAVCLVVGTRAVANEPQLASNLLTFLTAALLMYQPLKALSGTFSQVKQGLASADRLFELLDAAPESDDGATVAPLTRELQLQGVTVRYADGREALKRIDLTIPAGQTVALVGPSGAGKTTVLHLLLRFVDATDGAVRWDGANVTALQRSSLRRQVAWVPQEPVLLSGSVRENLKLAKPEASDEQLWLALRRAHAEDFVRGFAGGLDEPVGERGSRLSGGQRQRLAIARAFLVEPSVLLLDEPTSALDASAEAEVQAGLRELMAGRTVVVVAHRLSTVRDASLLYVLEDGTVVESGTPAALDASGGRYARMLAAAR